MIRMLSGTAAAALSLALLMGAPSLAQMQTAEEVMTSMSALGIDTDGLVLTEDQVLQVETILNKSEDDSEKVAEIKALLKM